MSDTSTAPDLASLLYGSLDKSPADLAASLAGQGQPAAVPDGAKLMADPDDTVGADPADPIAAAEAADHAKDYELQPDSAVTAPEILAQAEAQAQPEGSAAEASSAAPAPAVEVPDLAPLFERAEADFQAAQTAAQEAAAKLAELQENAEGIVEFTPEVAEALQAKMRAEQQAENAFNELADNSIEQAIQAYPELGDDNHPATIAVKQMLEADPSLASRSPTALADLSVKIAAKIRATAPPASKVPVSQPKPAPGPVPAKAPAPAAAMASHAAAQQRAPGQSAQPSLVAQVAEATKAGSFAALLDQVLGGGPPGIRIA